MHLKCIPFYYVNYSYNEDGIRIEKKVNSRTHKYYLNGTDIIFEETPDGTIYYNYDSNGITGLEYKNKKYYFIKNAQSDIIGLLDEEYNKVANYTYDSWGKIISIEDKDGNKITDENNIAIINPFRYRSYYYDSESEMYYLNSRYYNPDTGRFLNADGLIGTIEYNISYNLYSYASNNPVNVSDYDGENPIVLAGTGTAAIYAVAAAVVIYYGTKAISNAAVGIYGSIAVTKTNTKSKSQKNSTEKKHTVYTLRNSSNIVVYVGRTVNPDERKKQHKRNIERQYLTFVQEAGNLTRMEARGMEQYIINNCGTLKSGKQGSNKINGIRWDHPSYQDYMDAATMFMDEHETKVECN